MKWKNAHQMTDLDEVIGRFKQDGQNKRAKAVELLRNNTPLTLYTIIAMPDVKDRDSITITKVAQFYCKRAKAHKQAGKYA